MKRHLPMLNDAVPIIANNIRPSLYWDDFSRRINETVDCLKTNQEVPVRRVAVFITDQCNFRCGYCNTRFGTNMVSEERFDEVVKKYGDTAIIHITGGEPGVVKWLYPYIAEHGDRYRFHLNTNAYRPPPTKIRRLKVSLDSHHQDRWNDLVGRPDAFQRVTRNTKEAIDNGIVTSITCTLSFSNYRDSVEFARFVGREFPGLYALFFSVYKGSNPLFAWDDDAAQDFFSNILPRLKDELGEESLALLNETQDEKRRLMQGVRFPENAGDEPCYISMSERVISPTGEESYCSHLYRDGIKAKIGEKHSCCLYGCNRRLVAFNQHVENLLK